MAAELGTEENNMGKEGWTWIIGSPKWHYMRDGYSLCRKWFLLRTGDLEQGNDTSSDNCKACMKKLLKEKKNEKSV